MDTSVFTNSDWAAWFANESKKDYFSTLSVLVDNERKRYNIFPKEEDVFTAFRLCGFHQTKVVIIGQDPYHGQGQAHGLSFSVRSGVRLPPSLQNIFKEIASDLNIPVSSCGDLSSWAKQGVMLLNSILTVRENSPASHKNIGWNYFTDSAIRYLSYYKEHLVFILWGAFAQSKRSFIDTSKHCIIASAHPSPLSAYQGFFSSRPFSRTNEYLRQNNIAEIDWSLPNSR
ncbi:MAG: uracil-DNA glycosylase [Bacteroidales bacterium]|jgi:uracil-DNA glycosylase|nr:uracil-DNA glycosylase [Bacteroidales bacterium]